MTSFFGGGTFTAKIYLSKVGFIIDYELKMKFQENVYFTKWADFCTIESLFS